MQAYHKIIVATDFSPGSEHAARRGQLLAEQNNAELILLHVVEGFPEDLPVEWVGPEDVDPKTWITERAMQSLQAFAERLGITEAKWDVVFSDRGPRQEIVAYAQQQEADLILLGATGAHGIVGLLGTTVCGVIQTAQCDVLAVRTV